MGMECQISMIEILTNSPPPRGINPFPSLERSSIPVLHISCHLSYPALHHTFCFSIVFFLCFSPFPNFVFLPFCLIILFHVYVSFLVLIFLFYHYLLPLISPHYQRLFKSHLEIELTKKSILVFICLNVDLIHC